MNSKTHTHKLQVLTKEVLNTQCSKRQEIRSHCTHLSVPLFNLLSPNSVVYSGWFLPDGSCMLAGLKKVANTPIRKNNKNLLTEKTKMRQCNQDMFRPLCRSCRYIGRSWVLLCRLLSNPSTLQNERTTNIPTSTTKWVSMLQLWQCRPFRLSVVLPTRENEKYTPPQISAIIVVWMFNQCALAANNFTWSRFSFKPISGHGPRRLITLWLP